VVQIHKQKKDEGQQEMRFEEDITADEDSQQKNMASFSPINILKRVLHHPHHRGKQVTHTFSTQLPTLEWDDKYAEFSQGHQAVDSPKIKHSATTLQK